MAKRFVLIAFVALALIATACRIVTPVSAPQPEPTTTPQPAPTATLEPATTFTPQVNPQSQASTTPEAASEPVPAIFNLPWDDRSPFRPGLVQSAQTDLDGLDVAPVYHLDVTIGDDLKTLTGREEVRFTNITASPLDSVYFRLFPNIFGGESEISALTANGQAVQGVLEEEKSVLRVPLSFTLQPGNAVIIGMSFKVSVPSDGNSNYNTFSYTRDVLALAQFYPTIPALDKNGWYTEVPSKIGDVTYNEASFYLVHLNVPANLVVVATGRVIDRQDKAGRQEVNIACGPAREFYLAASPKYTRYSSMLGEVTINSYTSSAYETSGKNLLTYATRALQDFSRRFGQYPYTELDIVSTPTEALGIEYPGLIVLAENMYNPNFQNRGISSDLYLETTLAHEAAHQWFYNLVGDDQIHEPWLDEATAQYVTGLYFDDAHGKTAGESYRKSWSDRWDSMKRQKIRIGLPVKEYSEQAYSAIIYGRGPIVIQEIAQAMQEVKFDHFLKDYVQAYRWKIATGEGFKKLAEQDCACDLTPIFTASIFPSK